ncbi:MAG: queuosine salvage family protein [Deltaproteobacteria bacterium]|nr:queuosine salvage family protein [Deltaproteobacteria bacterium]
MARSYNTPKWEVLEKAQNVARISSQVVIEEEAIKRLCKRIVEEPVTVPAWNRRYHFDGRDRDKVFYLLVLDSLNFCLWQKPGADKWRVRYKSETLSGYYALAASLKKALESGIPITRADYLAGLSLGKLKQILGGTGELQLLQDRVKILDELAQLLLEEYGGETTRLVESAGMSAVKLVRLLVEKLSSFQDVAQYLGHTVFFYKRAQIFAADLYGAFDGRDWGYFSDMDRLTAFADYKLPQVLRHAGILCYGQALAQKVDQRMQLTPGSPDEVEIRANTIWAVELMRQELNRMGRDSRAFEIDWILWNMGQDLTFKARPHHRTVTIFY